MNAQSEPHRRDIEETDEVLDSLQAEYDVGFWENKQRELLTSTVDYTLGVLADLIENRAIDLSPGYQRRTRWTRPKQSLLIESFLMNVPVPPVFLHEQAYGEYAVIDGKQRLTAISDFFEDKLRLTALTVFRDLNNRTFSELPLSLQAALRTRPSLRAVIILRQSDPDIKNLVFHRLNTGGVTLNPQEVRNNAYPGPLNDLIQEVSGTSRFHKLLHIKNRDRSAVYREMRDAEFVLRYFTFRETWQTFAGGMELRMDSFMEENQTPSGDELLAFESLFTHSLDLVEAAFGDHTFQRWMPERQQWRQPVLASLYDAQMFGVQGFSAADLQSNQEPIVLGIQELFSDTEFRQAVDAATNTPTYFRRRIERVRQLLSEIIN